MEPCIRLVTWFIRLLSQCETSSLLAVFFSVCLDRYLLWSENCSLFTSVLASSFSVLGLRFWFLPVSSVSVFLLVFWLVVGVVLSTCIVRLGFVGAGLGGFLLLLLQSERVRVMSEDFFILFWRTASRVALSGVARSSHTATVRVHCLPSSGRPLTSMGVRLASSREATLLEETILFVLVPFHESCLSVTLCKFGTCFLVVSWLLSGYRMSPRDASLPIFSFCL